MTIERCGSNNKKKSDLTIEIFRFYNILQRRIWKELRALSVIPNIYLIQQYFNEQLRDIKGRQLVSHERLNNDKWVYTTRKRHLFSTAWRASITNNAKLKALGKLSKNKEIVVNVRTLNIWNNFSSEFLFLFSSSSQSVIYLRKYIVVIRMAIIKISVNEKYTTQLDLYRCQIIVKNKEQGNLFLTRVLHNT